MKEQEMNLNYDTTPSTQVFGLQDTGDDLYMLLKKTINSQAMEYSHDRNAWANTDGFSQRHSLSLQSARQETSLHMEGCAPRLRCDKSSIKQERSRALEKGI